MRGIFLLLVLAAPIVGIIWSGQFGVGPVIITNEYEYKIPLLLGAPWRDFISEPGIQLRFPFVESVITLDKRLQYLDAEPVELVIGDQTLMVDYYAVWQITDPLAFRRSYPLGMSAAQSAIQRRLKSLVGATIGRLSLQELLSRAQVLEELDAEVSAALGENGIRVLDVRISRTELPQETESAAFDQMREQRRAISRQHRAMGEREAREMRAKAEREARTIRAEARSRSEVIRGEGDARASEIYAAAYSQDAEFYSFVRSLEAYRATLREGTTMVLPPEHEFFKYLEPDKAWRAASQARQADSVTDEPAPATAAGP